MLLIDTIHIRKLKMLFFQAPSVIELEFLISSAFRCSVVVSCKLSLSSTTVFQVSRGS